ncbi:phosphoglycerate kinase [Escherichia coli]
MSVIKMTDLDPAGKRVFIRADLNASKRRESNQRRAYPCFSADHELALKQGAKVMVTSHLGRPTEGEYNEEFSAAGC